MSRKSYLWILGVLYLAWWVLMAIKPLDFSDWLMENVLVVLAVCLLVFTYKSFPLSRVSYTCIFIFMMLHALGAHYTYAKVPYQEWIPALAGGRNHFDRLGHFMQGFVPALVVREILFRNGIVRGRGWLFFVTVCVCMAISVSYEFVEWAAALILGQGADAFLGTQGDPWDTQWDMFLATVGAIAAQLCFRSAASPKRS